jgi:hypothetical protein
MIARFGVLALLVSLLPLELQAVDVKTPQPPPPIMFDRNAQMTGNPPTVVRAGDTLTFTIVQDEMLLKKQNDEVAGALLDAAAEASHLAGDAGDKLLIVEPLLGLTGDQLRNLRRTFCDSAAPLIAGGTGRADLMQQQHDVCIAGGTVVPNVLPAFEVLSMPYSITLKCRDAAVKDVTADAGSLKAGRFPFTATPEAGCSDTQYELRKLRPLAALAARWAQDHPIPPPLLIDLAAERRNYNDKEKEVASGLVATNRDLQACLAKKVNPIPPDAQHDADRNAAIIACTTKTTEPDAQLLLETAALDMTKSSDRIIDILRRVGRQQPTLDWVSQWLWFTGGHPTYHPLLADRGGADGNALSAAKTQLALLDAQLAMIDKLAPSAKLETAAALKESVEGLGQIRAQRDAAAASVTSLTQRAADSAAAGERDTLLYRGEIFVVQPGQPLIAMRHHDGKANFVMLNTVSEIAENERLAVLAENVDPSLQLKIVQTVTAITNDRGRFVEELMRSAGSNDVPQRGPLANAARTFQNAYRVLVAVVTMADEELVTPATYIPLLPDQSPALVTNVIPHDIPGPAPANVTYKILGAEDKEVSAGSYRVNHLYRARFRTGLIYSTLDQATVTTATTPAEAKTTHGRHGADATFGVQVYFSRRDMRTISWRQPAFSFYSGLTARDVTKNLLIGLCWEPIGGVTLTGGVHIGRSDLLDGDDHDHVIEQWRRKPFIGLTFDVDFLKQLLTLRPAL